MPRLRTSDLAELGCVTYMTVREHQRQAYETEIILDPYATSLSAPNQDSTPAQKRYDRQGERRCFNDELQLTEVNRQVIHPTPARGDR